VSDQETLPGLFQEIARDRPVYNLAQMGMGPNDILHALAREELLRDVPVKNGTAIYLFLPFHEIRVTCPLSIYFHRSGFFIWDKPSYELAGDGGLVPIGPCKNNLFRHGVLRFLAQSAFLRRMNAEWPLPKLYDSSRLMAKIVAGIRAELLRRGAAEMLVVAYPWRSRETGKFVSAFRAEGLPVLDLSRLDLPGITEGNHRIPGDGHPSGRANVVLAEIIAHYLKYGEAGIGEGAGN
jgi:hypothetical protein